jgi:hypothetical protein
MYQATNFILMPIGEAQQAIFGNFFVPEADPAPPDPFFP